MLLFNEAQMTIPHDHHPIYKLFPGKSHQVVVGTAWSCINGMSSRINKAMFVKHTVSCLYAAQLSSLLDLNKSFVETALFFVAFLPWKNKHQITMKGKKRQSFSNRLPNQMIFYRSSDLGIEWNFIAMSTEASPKRVLVVSKTLDITVGKWMEPAIE